MSPITHGIPSPIHLVPQPEEIPTPTLEEYAKAAYVHITKTTEAQFQEHLATHPIDFRYIFDDQIKAEGCDHTGLPFDYRRYFWFKVNGTISDDIRAHAVALAYASDHTLMTTSIHSHGGEWNVDDVGVHTSLDHAVYFHDVYHWK